MMRSCLLRSFGAVVWMVIFALKFVVVGTMVAYDQIELNAGASGAEGHAWTTFDESGQPGQYYDEDGYPVDERVAA